MIQPTGNGPFDTASLSSEMQRQQDQATSVINNSGRPPVGPGAAMPIQYDTKKADISNLRRLAFAAIANNRSPSVFLNGLQALGVGLYG
jgi:hypothetical protein